MLAWHAIVSTAVSPTLTGSMGARLRGPSQLGGAYWFPLPEGEGHRVRGYAGELASSLTLTLSETER